jgi:uncharacterized circularly permuted ATP-grasp superfamily protein/uncharacterized alpha-E superfamily protein
LAQFQFQSQGSLPFPPFSTDAEGGVAQSLLRHAAPGEPGVWDELRQRDGSLREPWQQFAQWLPNAQANLPNPLPLSAELDRRVAQVARQIELDGVTHNVFGEQGAASRPWSLALLPLMIPAKDWAVIEAGVIQRARVLEAVLADIYGPQRLLHEGILPPALVLRHPGYLRPMQGVRPAGGRRLHIVAFDLARGPEETGGRWWIAAKRTQGPSGLGYVLHNRLVISRQFPDAFRELHVQHIASSYRRLLDSVDESARTVAGGATPRVVLLTPGPYSETYFEHAYLARYLGLPLVEGGDLTVRGDRLFLKTVEGLEPVHGVLRRIDDDWCDPLELRPDSALGVPGLLQAARAGTVVMANALGSAFLESPALPGFLPGIAQKLLGESLVMPSLPTWWCGEGAAWRNVRGALHDKVVRSTFPRGGRTTRILDPGQPGVQLASAIDQDPDAWTVQGRLRFSRTPLWHDGALLPRPAMVRVFAISDAQGRWHVLPGGMTRVAQREDTSVSMQRGGTSLDTWVLTDGPVDTFSMLPQRLQVDDIAARRRPVSSRTGENLFWLGRYTERTEQMVRLARATLMLIDADSDADDAVLLALSNLAISTGLAPMGVPKLVQSAHHFERSVLMGLADPRSSSVAFNLAALSRASQALRERLSSEQWGLIRAMGEHFVKALDVAEGQCPSLPQVLPALDKLAIELAAVTGTQTDRMTRDHGWRLLTVGRLLERLIGVTQRLQAFLDTQALHSAAGIDLLLDLFDSTITFRARYQRREDLLALADLLVLDTANPRAFGGVLRRLRTELRKLPGDEASIAPLLALLPAEGSGLVLEALRGASDEQIAAKLHEITQELGQAALALSDQIGQRYFTLAQGEEQAI